MLQLLTTEIFADWFAALDDQTAEDVATMLDVVERLGPAKAAPDSGESLLWYEHPSVSQFRLTNSFAWDLEGWGRFRDYTKRVLAALESPRFVARLALLGTREASTVLECTRKIGRAADPRLRWGVKLAGIPLASTGSQGLENACEEIRRLYFEALEAAGLEVEDVPAHSLALREIGRRVPGPAFRLLYGVHAERGTALLVLGEWLDRNFYGDSVRRAERMWNRFLSNDLQSVEPARLR